MVLATPCIGLGPRMFERQADGGTSVEKGLDNVAAPACVTLILPFGGNAGVHGCPAWFATFFIIDGIFVDGIFTGTTWNPHQVDDRALPSWALCP